MTLLSFGSHLEDHLHSSVMEFTEKYGAKAGILEYLRQFPDLEKHILPWFYVSAEARKSGNLPDLPQDFHLPPWSLLYRSTHPDDHRGYIGMLPTFSDAIKSERKDTLSDYLEWNDRIEYYVLNALKLRHKYGEKYPNSSHEIYYYGQDTSWKFDDRWRSIQSGEIPMPDFDVEIEKLLSSARHKEEEEKSPNGRYRRNITNSATDIEDLNEYTKRRNLRGTEATGIYIQPKIAPWEHGHADYPVGSIFENPHKPGSYVVSYRIPNTESERIMDEGEGDDYGLWAFMTPTDTLIIEEKNGRLKSSDARGSTDHYVAPEFFYQILWLYKKVREKNIFGKECSFHMEYGFLWPKDPLVYQIRQYAPFETASFSLDWEKFSSTPAIIRGITNETGFKIRYVIGNTNIRRWNFIRNGLSEWVSGVISTSIKNIPDPEIPLNELQFWSAASWSDLDLCWHAWFSYLFETGGVAIARNMMYGDNPDSQSHGSDHPGVYECTVISDGVSCIIDGVTRIE